MAAVISNGGGYYSTFGYLSEARRMGLRILAPDINESEIKYTGNEKELRVGSCSSGAFKGGSRVHCSRTIQTRTLHHPPPVSASHIRHLHLQDVRVLIKPAALIPLPTGNTARSSVEGLRFFETSRRILLDLFGSPVPFTKSPYSPFEKGGRGSSLSGYPASLMLKHELDTLGFYLSIHPLDHYKNVLKGFHYVNACDLHLHVGSISPPSVVGYRQDRANQGRQSHEVRLLRGHHRNL